MDTIIKSSNLTRSWLEKIKAGVSKANPSIIYDEVKYWAKFKSPNTDRIIAWLNPNKNSIRLFIGLDPDTEQDIKKSPSHWKRFKSLFRINSEKKISQAIELIIQSFNYDHKVNSHF